MAADKNFAAALRPASFRGVPFQVTATDAGFGRRTQVHEYPQRDKPYVEDLGRATRDLNFDGFLIGADYVDQANKLIAALEEAGGGTLVHPWFGELKVALKDPARVAFNAGLGQATVSMSFVEAGELAFPAASASTQAQTRIAAVDIQNSAVDDFAGAFDIGGFQDFVVEAAGGNIGSVLGLVGGGSVPGLDELGYVESMVDTVQSALGLLANPAALGWKIASALGISSLASSTTMNWTAVVRSLLRLVSSPGLANPAAPSIYTPSRQQIFINNTATNTLVRQSLLAQAVGATSLMPATVYEETVGVRRLLAAALDSESLSANDTAYQSLQAARGQVWADLTERARDSARLATLTPNEVSPALVLSYDQYEDATRDAEIIARNGIRHPGFVPVEPLKVLTR